MIYHEDAEEIVVATCDRCHVLIQNYDWEEHMMMETEENYCDDCWSEFQRRSLFPNPTLKFAGAE